MERDGDDEDDEGAEEDDVDRDGDTEEDEDREGDGDAEDEDAEEDDVAEADAEGARPGTLTHPSAMGSGFQLARFLLHSITVTSVESVKRNSQSMP